MIGLAQHRGGFTGLYLQTNALAVSESIIHETHPAASRNIVSVGYDSDTATLEVEFRERRVYRYTQVSEDTYAALMKAKSKGSHFHRHIRDRYPTTRVR